MRPYNRQRLKAHDAGSNRHAKSVEHEAKAKRQDAEARRSRSGKPKPKPKRAVASMKKLLGLGDEWL